MPVKETGGYQEGITEGELKTADWEAIGQKVMVNVDGELKAYK